MFNEVVSRISRHGTVRLINEHLETACQGVRLLSEDSTGYTPGTIYVGKASQVPAGIHPRSDIGLILVNDRDFDFSLLQAKTAVLPPETDLFSLFNDVLDVLNSRRRVVDGSAVLLNCLIQGNGLNDIIRTGGLILGRPVSLVDLAGKLLAVSNPQAVSPADLTPDGYLKQEIYSTFRTHKFTKKVNESPIPVLVDFDHSELPRMIVGKIVIGNKIVGHLAVMENEQPFSDEDVEIARVLIDVVSSEIQKNDYHLLMAGIHHEYFILDLLQEKHENPTTIEDKVKSLKWDAYNDFYTAAIHIPRKEDAFYFVEYLRTRLGNIFPFSKSIYYDENVILVLYKYPNMQEIVKKVEPILLENNLTAGISLKFSSIVDLKGHYEQAKHALSIGKLLKKDEHVYLYDDLYLYDLLTIISGHANLKDFCHQGIDNILKFDEAHGTDYYKTLFEYLMCGANMAQAAKKLFIHRNTLYHRIQKICELTGMNLDNGDDYLKLLVSFKIMELSKIGSDLVI